MERGQEPPVTPSVRIPTNFTSLSTELIINIKMINLSLLYSKNNF